jgi:hypothetical protein
MTTSLIVFSILLFLPFFVFFREGDKRSATTQKA